MYAVSLHFSYIDIINIKKNLYNCIIIIHKSMSMHTVCNTVGLHFQQMKKINCTSTSTGAQIQSNDSHSELPQQSD